MKEKERGFFWKKQAGKGGRSREWSGGWGGAEVEEEGGDLRGETAKKDGEGAEIFPGERTRLGVSGGGTEAGEQRRMDRVGRGGRGFHDNSSGARVMEEAAEGGAVQGVLGEGGRVHGVTAQPLEDVLDLRAVETGEGIGGAGGGFPGGRSGPGDGLVDFFRQGREEQQYPADQEQLCGRHGTGRESGARGGDRTPDQLGVNEPLYR